MQLQHDGKDDAMEYDIILSDEMHELGILVIPVRFPVLACVQPPLTGGADVADGGVKPYV